MLKKKFNNYQIASIVLFIIIFFILILLNYSNCNVANVINSSKTFGIENSIKNCKSNIKKFWYFKVRDVFINTIFEEKLRIYKSKKFGSRYVVLKKKHFEKKEQENNDSLEVPFVKGIKDNLDDYLIDDVGQSQNENNTWLRSHGGNKNLKFNNSKFNITPENIGKLKLKWKLQTIKPKKIKKYWKQNIEINPVFTDNKIIFVSADLKIIAVNVINGKVIWEIQCIDEPARRGMVLSEENNNKYLFINIKNKLYKINIENGKLEKKFADNGYINITRRGEQQGTLIAPVLFNNNIYISSFDKVVGYNIETGEEFSKVSFHPPGRKFWGGIPWGGSALDENYGILYLSTGNPRPALVGINRPGNNYNSNSLIAIDLIKNKILWKFQDVAHDLWDYDMASPPILTELKINDKILEVVVATTKTGNVLIFERKSGKPFFDINYSKAPQSIVPGEVSSPFQIDLVLPEKISKVEYSLNDINKLDETTKKYISAKLENSSYGWFKPPEIGKKTIIYGLHGGSTWPGSTIDPKNNLLFTPVNEVPFYTMIEGKTLSEELPDAKNAILSYYYKNCSSCHGKNRNGIFDPNTKKEYEISKNYIPSLIALSFNRNNFEKVFDINNLNKKHQNIDFKSDKINSLKKYFAKWDDFLLEKDKIQLFYHWSTFTDSNNRPASNPPWGKVISMDIKTGKILWEKNIGKLNDNEDSNNMTGTINYGGVALSSGGVIFVTGTADGYIYGLNSKNGDVLWQYKMNAAGSSPPILYEVDGKQHLSILSTGGFYEEYDNKDSTIYTFAIDEK
tara:strand:- start:250 stop:2628 length:2379 start_codon:yes stop_codon:yes gene_type:complete